MSYNIGQFDNFIRTYLLKKINNKYPNIDTTKNSVFDDLYTKPTIESLMPFLDSVNELDMVMDLSNSDLIDDTILEAYGENNFGLIRGMGEKASAIITVSYTKISTTDPTIIPMGTKFTSRESDVAFQTVQEYIFLPEELINSYNTETVLYEVNISVKALDIGEKYNVGAGQINTFPETLSLFIDNVSNKEDATGGIDKESKDKYIERIRTYYISRYLGTAPGYEQDILNMVPGIFDIYIVGKNMPEMTRDLFTVLINDTPTGIHIGGKTDIYIKGSLLEQRYFDVELYTNKIKLTKPLSGMDASSIVITNLTEPSKVVAFSKYEDLTTDSLTVTIDNQNTQSYDSDKLNDLQVNYNTSDGQSASESFKCGLMQYDFETPMISISDIYNTFNEENKYSTDIVTLKRTDSDGNIINEASPYYMSSQEIVTVRISDEIDIVNGTDITISYVINNTVGVLRNHYMVDKNRITGSDILIKEAEKKYINIRAELKLKEMETLTDTKKSQITNAINLYIQDLKIGASANESDIVSSVYRNNEIMEYLSYIKLPLKGFYSPNNISEPIEDIRVEESVISPSTTAYITLNKIDIVLISQ